MFQGVYAAVAEVAVVWGLLAESSLEIVAQVVLSPLFMGAPEAIHWQHSFAHRLLARISQGSVHLTFWRRNYFLILAHSVYKM